MRGVGGDAGSCQVRTIVRGALQGSGSTCRTRMDDFGCSLEAVCRAGAWTASWWAGGERHRGLGGEKQRWKKLF